MTGKRLPKSMRKYIRREKARIRRVVLDTKEQEKFISELCQKIYQKRKQHDHSRDLQLSDK